MKKGVILSAVILIVSLLITACSANQQIDDSENNNTSAPVPTESRIQSETENPPEKTGVIAEQILNGNDGEIHYSSYLPEDYDGSKTYPLVMTMPGYGMMLLCISLWLKTTSITALKRHALPMTTCKRPTVKRDIQLSKSANCWLLKSPTTNTLTAAEFTTTTAEEISFSMTKTF